MKYIDSSNQPIYDTPTTLILDVEVEAKDGRFPTPGNTDGRIICVTVNISFNEGSVCYGLKEIPQELRDTIARAHGRYVTYKDERDILTRVLTSIYCAKPTHARGEDTIPAFDFLTARAKRLGIKIGCPDFDSMFRQYDHMPYSARKPVVPPANPVLTPMELLQRWAKIIVNSRYDLVSGSGLGREESYMLETV